MRWPYLNRVVQDEEVDPSGEGGGGGDPPTDPPTDPPKDPPSDPPSIPLDVIPEELRGKSEAEMKYLLSHMADSTATGATQIRALQDQLTGLQEQISSPPPAEPDPDDELSDEELISSNPEKAVLRIMERTGIVDRFTRVETEVVDTVVNQVARDFDDFQEHQDQIEAVLKQTGVPRTRNNVIGAYTMALGLAQIKKREEAKKTQSSLDPTPPKGSDEADDPKVLTGLAADIFDSSGMSREEWDKLSGDEEELGIKVPT